MGRPKLLLPFGDSTILGSLVAAFRAAGVERIVVVAVAENRELCEWVENQGLLLTINPDPERGMLSSLWAGLERLGARDSWAGPLLVSPADLPALRPDTIRRVIDAVNGGALLAQPRYEGRNGHPLGVSPTLVPEIFELDLNRGLKQLRELHAAQFVTFEVDDAGSVLDVDTPEDLRALDSNLRLLR